MKRAWVDSSASSASHTSPGSLPSCGSGPATPVTATATSASNNARAPAAISRAHASLTTPSRAIVAAATPSTRSFTSGRYVTAEPRK